MAMLQADKPQDYVIASGEKHSVREFIEKSLELIGVELAWQGSGVDETGIVSSVTQTEVSRKYSSIYSHWLAKK